MLTLVIIHQLDFPCGIVAPFEANPPLVVDANAVLAAAISVQSFKTVTRRNPEIIELPGRVDREKLGSRPGLNLIRKQSDDIAGEQCRCPLVREAPDHVQDVPNNGTSVKSFANGVAKRSGQLSVIIPLQNCSALPVSTSYLRMKLNRPVSWMW